MWNSSRQLTSTERRMKNPNSAILPVFEALEPRRLACESDPAVAAMADQAATSAIAVLQATLPAGAVIAANRTTPTLCAEQDNVNVPLAIASGKAKVSFSVEAFHPGYAIGEDQRDADFTNCPPGAPSV